MKKRVIAIFLIIIVLVNVTISLVFASNVIIEVRNLDSSGAVISVASDEKISRVIIYKKDANGNYVRFFENSENGYSERDFFISRYSLSETDKTNFKVDVVTESGRSSTENVEVDKVPKMPEPKVDQNEDNTYDENEDGSNDTETSSNGAQLNLNNRDSSSINDEKSVKPTSIFLSQKSLTLTIGEKKQAQLKLTMQPSNAKDQLTWSTDNKSVASVDKKGVVTGNKTGTATIQVKTGNGLVAQCKVTVKVKKIKGTISKSNSTALFKVNAVNKCTAAESLTITDKYYVVNKIKNSANRVKNASDNCAIYVYDINTKKRVNTLIGDFGHSNGATYVAEDKSIYICHMADRKITKISTSNLEANKLKRKVMKFPVATTSIEYDSYTNQWILKNANKVSIYSKDLKKLKRTFTVPCHIYQDCAAYNGLLLSIDYVKPCEAYIYVYNINTKECYGKYKVTIPRELESIAYDQKNDRFVMLFNDSVGDTVYATKAINLKKYY